MTTLVVLASALAVGGCGGSEPSGDIEEPSADFEVELTRADFDRRQTVAKTADLVVAVRNTGDEALPQLAVTIWTGRGGVDAAKPSGSFNVQVEEARTEPVWVPAEGFPKLLEGRVTAANAADAPSAGAVAAQTDTFVFGELEAGDSRTVLWRVTPVRPGRYQLNYAVAAGLAGKAQAVAPGGGQVGGEFRVRIGSQPG